MRKVSLERYYFVLNDGALTLNMLKMVLDLFCVKTLHIQCTSLDQLSSSSWLDEIIHVWKVEDKWVKQIEQYY